MTGVVAWLKTGLFFAGFTLLTLVGLLVLAVLAVALRPHVPGVVTVRRFDLDDVRAEVAEVGRTVRSCQHRRQVEDSDPFERTGVRHRIAPSSFSSPTCSHV